MDTAIDDIRLYSSPSFILTYVAKSKIECKAINLNMCAEWDRQHCLRSHSSERSDYSVFSGSWKQELHIHRKKMVLEGERTFMCAVGSRHQGDSCAPSPSAQMFSNIEDRSTSTTINEPTRCGGSGSAAEGVANGSSAMNM